MYKFNAEKTKDEVVTWIRDWFDINGRECNAVIGVSGGVDSSVVASLCVEALGKDRVFGVKLPCGVQPDINFATQLINHLEIKHCTVNILNAVNVIKNKIDIMHAKNLFKLQLMPSFKPELSDLISSEF